MSQSRKEQEICRTSNRADPRERESRIRRADHRLLKYQTFLFLEAVLRVRLAGHNEQGVRYHQGASAGISIAFLHVNIPINPTLGAEGCTAAFHLLPLDEMPGPRPGDGFPGEFP